MTGIRKALFISILTEHSIQIINLAFTVILARLITPAELGVYAIASSVSILAMQLRSMGAGQYLIREKTIDDTKIRSATGLLVLISGSLGIFIAISAPFISNFYKEPALTYLLWIITATFILSPFTTVPNALITRDMKFQQIFVVKFLSAIVLTGSTIGLVLAGFSYYGLAWGIFFGAFSEFLVTNYYRPKWAPWLPSFSGLKSLLRFGMFTTTSELFVKFSESISDLVIGRVGSMADVGIFSRGFGFVLFLNRIIGLAAGPVTLPFLSSIKRDGGSVGHAYLKIVLLQGAFNLPVFAVVNAAAYPVIRLLFGEQWDLAIPIASVLALWAIFQSIHTYSGSALISIGKEKLMFIASLITFATRITAIIFVTIVYTPFNLITVAWAFAVSGVIELIVKTWTVRSAMSLSVSSQLFSILPNCIVAVICWRSAIFINQLLPYEETEAWLSVAVLAGTMPIIWLGSLFLIDHELWTIIKNILSDMRKHRV